MHREAGALEQIDRDRTDATGWACDRDRPHLRCLMIFQHPSQREGRGEAGGADRHRLAQAQTIGLADEIGRASCRERVCQYVYISVVAVSLKKNKTQTILRRKREI